MAKLTGMECNHAILRKRTRDLDCRAREERAPLSTQDTARARHEALEYLASALAAPSLVDDPRVAGIVRESTDHGKTVVSFLLHVMHGAVRGFGPRNRVQAACELLGHIARDELARSGALTPSPSTEEGREPALSLPKDEGDSSAKAGFLPQGPSPVQRDLTVVPDGTKTVRPELVEEPAPYPIRGQRSGSVIVERSPDQAETDDTDEPEDHRGTYDIDRKLAEAQHDPSHPVHKFVEAYDEVAATFRRQDGENDNNEDVRSWISGEVRDDYGKYIWEYAPADPRAHEILRPKRRRRRSTPKAESVWVPMPVDERREQGIPPPKRSLMWV